MEERSILIGMMSEICAKARILLARLRGEGLPISLSDAERKILELERQMSECSSEFEKMVAR